jgi:hypothetical protein
MLQPSRWMFLTANHLSIEKVIMAGPGAYASCYTEDTSSQRLGMGREARAHLHVGDSICDIKNRKEDHDNERHRPVCPLDVDESKNNAGSLHTISAR